MPLNSKAKLVEKYKGKSAQDIQDELFRGMSADKKLEIAAGLWRLAKELDSEKINFRRGLGLLSILIIVLIISAAGIGGGFYFKESQKQKSLLETGNDAIKKAEELKEGIESRSAIQDFEKNTEAVVGKIDTSGWKTYRNEKYGFEVRYPENLIMVKTDSTAISIQHIRFPERISAGIEEIADYRKYQWKDRIGGFTFKYDENSEDEFVFYKYSGEKSSIVPDRIIADGILIYKFEEADAGFRNTGYFIPNKNTKRGLLVKYSSSASPYSEVDNAQMDFNQAIDQILSTFKFIE